MMFQALDDDAYVIDPFQFHTSTFRPSASARSHASATASVRAASAGGQATSSGSAARTAVKKREIDRNIGSANSPESVSPRDLPLMRYASGPSSSVRVASEATTSVA